MFATAQAENLFVVKRHGISIAIEVSCYRI